MGCNTCKQKAQKKQKEESIGVDGDKMTIDLLPKSVQENGLDGGSLPFKIIAFLVIILAIPLIILVLVGQIFLHFFLPKTLPKITKSLRNFFINTLNRYAKFRHDKEVKRRKKQWENTISYVDEEKTDVEEDSVIKEFGGVEIYDNKEKNNE
jgi:hypothetical protein